MKGQQFCRPQLSGGIQLTPQTVSAEVRAAFGEPQSEEDYPPQKILTVIRGRYFMEFEFEQSRLVAWSAILED